ncbi:MAG: trigger factor [Rhodospirillales bacterium]|nr:trigger factor [Rhodospirillales bacterium]
MEITETKAEGLTREFKIVVPADAIEGQVSTRLQELVHTVQLPGFRPGKVPVSLLRKRYGPSVMGEVLERTVNDSSQKAMSDRGLRPAMQPKIEITSFEDGSDLEYTMAVELMPDIGTVDFSDIKLQRMVVEADQGEIGKVLERLSKGHGTTETIETKRKSKNNDVLMIDFVGKIGDEEFAGGKAESYLLELGSGSFIPGFEDQLVGTKAGDKVKVEITFPESYGASDLAGKDAVFDVHVRELREPRPAAIDDELGKKMGLGGLDDLKRSIQEKHEREFRTVARSRLKRDLLDTFAETYDFEVPPAMAEHEFEQIWQHYEEHRKARDQDHDHDHDHDHEEDEFAGKSEDEIKEELRTMADRRVRLGLLLAEIGHQNNIEVSEEDLNRAMNAEAQRYPGQEQAVLDHFSKNPEALQSLRAPLYEEKVVDFILEMANITEKTVSVEELMKDPDEEKAVAEKPAGRKKKAAPKKKAAKKAE